MEIKFKAWPPKRCKSALETVLQRWGKRKDFFMGRRLRKLLCEIFAEIRRLRHGVPY
jgi:hypothetical protein